MLRSILAVVTGVMVWGTLWVSAGMGLASAMPTKFDQTGITTDPAVLVLLILICGLLCVLAGWLTGLIAGRSIMKHVSVLALVQLAIGILVQASVWDQMPLWYHLTFLSIVVPLHLLGGRMRVRQSEGGVSGSPVEATT